jgi:ornithine cyclodeaminase/alanine dehydrogenase-like protein (mu-crystallin family)
MTHNQLSERKVLYLSRSDVEALNLPMSAVIEAVSTALRELALGQGEMPPKHWLAPDERRFFSAMTSFLRGSGVAACKWQSGSPDNEAQGLPYITGLLILNDLPTGLPVAVMDSTWLTAYRTGAASAVAARLLAVPDPQTVAILGCGVQGRMNLKALLSVFSRLRSVRAYDIVWEHLERYAREVEAEYGLVVTRCERPREAMAGAQIVITAGPITPRAERTIEPGWLERGALGIALDYDCYWRPAALAAVDGLFTDNVDQLMHLKQYGYFTSVSRLNGELGEVAAGLKGGRVHLDQTLIVANLGIAVEDAVAARLIYDAALAQDRGTWLPL